MQKKRRGRKQLFTFDFHTDREKICIQMDAIKLNPFWIIFLSNAVKYTPEGGSVTLRLEIPGEKKDVRISVSDTGIGVPRQDQPYIFQRFFQSPKTAGKKEGQVSDFIS